MKIQKVYPNNAEQAASILVDAFSEDPLFLYIFGNHRNYYKKAPWLFLSWVKWSIKFGEAWMTEDENSVVLTRAINNSSMSLMSMIRAGMLATPFNLGWKCFKRFYFDIAVILERKNKVIMEKVPHWYGWMIGVRKDHRGLGKILLDHCMQCADLENVPLYIETSTLGNVKLYNHFDFELKDHLILDQANVDLFFMLRQPKTINNGS